MSIQIVIDLNDILSDVEAELLEAAKEERDEAAIEEARTIHDDLAEVLGQDPLPATATYDLEDIREIVHRLVAEQMPACQCGAALHKEDSGDFLCSRCRRSFQLRAK